MRVALGVAEGVVLAVQDRITARIQVRTALHQPGEEMDHPLGPRTHRVHLVGRVAVLEDALEEDAEEPVAGEEGVNHALLDSGTVMSLSRRVKKDQAATIGPGAGPRSNSR